MAGPEIPQLAVDGMARLVDVAPTLLGAAGIEPPASHQGADLLNDLSGAMGAGTEGAAGPGPFGLRRPRLPCTSRASRTRTRYA